MRRIALVALAVASTIAGSAGCTIRGRGAVYGPQAVVYVEEDPPPPQVVVTPVSRPGYLWVDGRWDYRGRHWIWVDGFYQPYRANNTWVSGRWERRGPRRNVWVQGRWESQRGGRPDVIDHRR